MTERDERILASYRKREEEDEKVKAYRQKDSYEKTEKRYILLLADKKIKFKDLYELYSFLMPFTPFMRIEYVKYELIQKSIMDDYLVKIYLDTDGLFHAEDMSQSDKWYEEAYLRKFKRLTDAFGDCDDADVRNY